MKLCKVKDIEELRNSNKVRNKDKMLWDFTTKEIYNYHIHLNNIIDYLRKRNEQTKS